MLQAARETTSVEELRGAPGRHDVRGKVYLVGAGPGDPDLLTLRAARLLQEADVVVHDRLVSDAILALAPPTTRRIFVGKSAARHTLRQEQINDLLVALSRRYRRVVRLKGGDPFLFGRGGEEAMRLAEAGVPFEITPGITSAQGCAAALAIPLTHRDAASSLRFVTGHCRDDGELELDWAGLADPRTTLVVYMGLANIDRIARELIGRGRDPGAPAIAVSNGSLPQQRHVSAPLREIGPAARAAALDGPVLFIIGEVVNIGLALGMTRHDAPAQALLAAE